MTELLTGYETVPNTSQNAAEFSTPEIFLAPAGTHVEFVKVPWLGSGASESTRREQEVSFPATNAACAPNNIKESNIMDFEGPRAM